MNSYKIGILIKKVRKERRFTQQELANGICDRTTISHYESGLIKRPSIHILKDIVSKFGMSIEEFFSQAGMKNETLSYKRRQALLFLLLQKNYQAARLLAQGSVYSSLSVGDRQLFAFVEGCYYHDIGQYETATKIFKRALFLTNPTNKNKLYTMMEFQIAHALLHNHFCDKRYDRQKLLCEIDDFKDKVCSQKEEIKGYGVIEMTLEIAYMYLALRQYAKAETCLAYVEEVSLQTRSVQRLDKFLLLKAEIACYQKQVDIAKCYIERAYCFLKATAQEESIYHLKHRLQDFNIKELFNNGGFSADM